MASVLAKIGTAGARAGGKVAAKKLAKKAAKAAAKKAIKGAAKSAVKGSGKKALKKSGTKAVKGVGRKAAKSIGKKRAKQTLQKTVKKKLKKTVKKGLGESKSEKEQASGKSTPKVTSMKGKEERKLKKNTEDKELKNEAKEKEASKKLGSKKKVEKVKKPKERKTSQESLSQSGSLKTSSSDVQLAEQVTKGTKNDELRKQRATASKEHMRRASTSEDTATSSIPQEQSQSISVLDASKSGPENKRWGVLSRKKNAGAETPTDLSATSTPTVSTSEELSSSAPEIRVTSGEGVSSTTQTTGSTTSSRRHSAVPSRPSQTFPADAVAAGGSRAAGRPSVTQEDQRPVKPRLSRTSSANVNIPESLKQSVHRDMLAKEAAREVEDTEFNLMLFRLAKHLMMEGSNIQHSSGKSKGKRKKKQQSSEWLQALSMVLDAQNAKLSYMACPNQRFRTAKFEASSCCNCRCGKIPTNLRETDEAKKVEGEAEELKRGQVKATEVGTKCDEVKMTVEATRTTDRTAPSKTDESGLTTEASSVSVSSESSSYTTSGTSSDFSPKKYREETDRLCNVIRAAVDPSLSRSGSRPARKYRSYLCPKSSKPSISTRSKAHRSMDHAPTRPIESHSQDLQPGQAKTPPPPAQLTVPPLPTSQAAAPALSAALSTSSFTPGLSTVQLPSITVPYLQPTLGFQLTCPPFAAGPLNCCCRHGNKDSRSVCCASTTSTVCCPSANDVLTPMTLCTTQCEPIWMTEPATQQETNPDFAVTTSNLDPNLFYLPDYCF